MFRGLSSASFLVVAGIVALLSGCSSPNEPPPKTYTLTILSTPGGATIPSGAVAVEPGVATHIQPNASGGYTCPLCLTLFDGTATISGFSVTLNDGDATVRVDWKPGPLPLPQPPFSPPALAPSGSFQILHDGTDVTNADFDFGSHVTFSSTTETFSVKNKTTSTVTLSAGNPYITDRRDFAPTAASGAPLSIAPDGTAEFHVQFIPTTTGQESADLYVDFTTIGAVSFPVRGTGASSGTDYLVQYQKNGTTWTTVKENDAIAFPALSSGSASVLFRIVNTG